MHTTKTFMLAFLKIIKPGKYNNKLFDSIFADEQV
jgi:hypothetical protein